MSTPWPTHRANREPRARRHRRRSSRPRARSIAPTPAASPSPCSTARSSRSTARTRTRSPTATSAPRSASSASASTDPIGCSIRRSASGRKGDGQFERVTWDEALELIADAIRTGEGDRRRRVDPALLLRRLERPADAGQPRRAAVAPVRHVAPGAHGLRRADRRGQHGALRQDAVGHLPGLPRGEADHPLGRQPVGVRHPPRPVRARGAEARREARRDRSAHDAAGAQRPTSTSRQAGHRRRRRARDPPLSVRERPRRRGVPARAHHAAPTELRERAEPWTFERAAEVAGVDAAALEARRDALRRELAGADPLRLGPRAQPQRRQRRDGGPGAAGGRRQVRRARRRLLDEQLGVVEHRAHLDRRAGAATRARQHEPSRPRAHRVRRSAGQRAVRLQLQPGGDRSRSAARARRASSARISSPSSSSR